MTVFVSTSAALRSAIQAASSTDPIQLTGSGSYSSIVTLGKISCATPTVQYSGYIVEGASSTLASSATLQDTLIYVQNVDGNYSPGIVQNLTLNYDKNSGASSNGGPLLNVTSTAARSMTINNVAFTGTHSGWNNNGNLYMSLRSFDTSKRLNATLSMTGVSVSITGQNNNFNGFSGGSAFLHNWNNNGVVTITGSNFDEAGFLSSFNFLNFNAPSSTTAAPVHIIGASGASNANVFRRSSNANVRTEGNVLVNVNATLTNNTFLDGSFVDIGGAVGGLTFNSNTFNTISNGYGIRVTASGLSGSPTFTGTNTFTGSGSALKYITSTANAFINYSGTFTVGGKNFTRLIASGQANDNLSLAATLAGASGWICVDDGNDTVQSGTGADCLIGGAGNDSLSGNSGLDVLDGGTGDDILIGGTGNDTLTGGAGADQFSYASGQASDTITDFSIGDSDQVRLASGSFSVTGATLTASDFQVVSSLSSPIAMGGKVTQLTSNYSAGSADTFTTTGGGNGYLLFFDSTANKSWLYYDQDWTNTTGRQNAMCFSNITTLAGLTAFGFAQFRT